MCNTRLSFFLSVFSIILAFDASAAIVYQQDDRYIMHTMATPSTMKPAPAFADFDIDWWAFEAGAKQVSSLGINAMSGTGSTYAGFDAQNYGAYGESVFSVTFGVDTLSTFTLRGNIDAEFRGGDVYAKLFENGTEIFTTPAYQAGNFNFDGVFDTGNTYQLYLYSNTYDSGYYNEAWQFDLNVSPVPVPAAAWLFASGLIGLLGYSRRR